MPSFLLRMGRLQRRSPASPMRSSLGATPQPPWHPRWLPAQRRPAATAAPAAAAASRSPWSSSQRPWRSRSSARSMHSVFWHGRRRQRWRSSRASRLAALSPARPWVDVAQRRQWDGTPPGPLQPFPGGWRPIYHPWTGAETLYEMARGAWGGVRRCLSLADNAAQRRVLLDIGCHRGAFTNFGACPPPQNLSPFPALAQQGQRTGAGHHFFICAPPFLPDKLFLLCLLLSRGCAWPMPPSGTRPRAWMLAPSRGAANERGIS